MMLGSIQTWTTFYIQIQHMNNGRIGFEHTRLLSVAPDLSGPAFLTSYCDLATFRSAWRWSRIQCRKRWNTPVVVVHNSDDYRHNPLGAVISDNDEVDRNNQGRPTSRRNKEPHRPNIPVPFRTPQAKYVLPYCFIRAHLSIRLKSSDLFLLPAPRNLDYSNLQTFNMSWSRLIRFIDTAGVTRFGEPEIKDATKLVDECLAGRLYAQELLGTEPFSLTRGSERVLVKQILAILRPSDVPIIRCVGLNYMKHSKFPCRSYNFV